MTPKPYRWPNDVEGYLGWHDGELLYQAALSAPPGLAVELGTYHGQASIVIAQARAHVLTIDHDEGEDYDHRIQRADHLAGGYLMSVPSALAAWGVADRVMVLRSRTQPALARLVSPIAFAFVDADHRYDAVLADWEALRPRMLPGAVIVWDDIDWPGVAAVLRARPDDWVEDWRTHRMACWRRHGPGS